MDEGNVAVPQYRPRAVTLKREATIIAAGLALLLAAAMGAWYLIYYQRSPSAVVDRFMAADRRGSYSEETQYVADRWDSRLVLSALQNYRQQGGASPFNGSRIAGTTVTGDSAQVNVELKLPAMTLPMPALPGIAPAPPPGNTTYVVTFVLIKQNGEWKIDPTQTLASLTGALLAGGLRGLPTAPPNLPNLFPGAPGAVPAPAPGPQPGSGAI